MPDKSLDILIRTLVDQHGAQATEEAFERVKKEGVSAHEETRKGAEKSEVSHRALHAALRQLGPEFSHTGHLALFAFANPATAAVIGLSAALGIALKKMEDAQKATEDMDRQLDQFQESIRKVADETTASDSKFKVWFDHLDERTGQIIDKFTKLKTIIAQAAEGAVPKPVLEEQAAERSLAQARAAAAAADEVALKAHLEATDTTRARELGVLPGLKEEQKKRVEQARKDIQPSFVKEVLAPILNEVFPGTFNFPFTTEEVNKDLQKRQDALSKNETALQRTNRRLTELTDAHNAALAEEEHAKSIAEDKHKEVRELEKIVGEPLAGTFSPEAMAHLRALRSRGPGQSIFTEAISGEEAVGMGRTLGASQQQAIAFLGNYLKQHGANQEQIIQLLQSLQDMTVSQADKIKALQDTIKNLNARTANNPT